jgi:thymidylate kinase
MNIPEYLEEFYADRMTHLVICDRFEDAHSLYQEFVVNDEEPEEYFYLPELV